MTLLRKDSALVLALLLAACGGQTPIASEGDENGASYTDADGNTWVPVPTTNAPPGFADDGFTPVSKKVPAGSSSGSSGSSGASSSSSGSTPPPPDDAYGGPPLTNDIDAPEIAKVCADRDAAKGAYTFTGDAIPAGRNVSITRDLTEHRYGDGIYRTAFTVFFKSVEKIEVKGHGRSRVETLTWLNVHLDSTVSQPSAFSVGQPEQVAIGWGDGDSLFWCSEDGVSTNWKNGERLPHDQGVVTLTRRDATGIAGTIDIGDEKLIFDAPFGESEPGEDGICCLRE